MPFLSDTALRQVSGRVKIFFKLDVQLASQKIQQIEPEADSALQHHTTLHRLERVLSH